jgi:hypothetical protein
MLPPECVRELQTVWLPNITDVGLDRLIDLLQTGSPLLIHGCFTRALPMGCLATHAAWHHPRTANLTLDAGITWLHKVAGLNPATSHVIREWDRHSPQDWMVRADFLRLLQEARRARQGQNAGPNRVADLVKV